MVQFNFTERTIKAKVVYYGPAQSGKTTNLEQIHRLTDPAANNRLISLNTAQDRTLFFDLLPVQPGSGFGLRLQDPALHRPGAGPVQRDAPGGAGGSGRRRVRRRRAPLAGQGEPGRLREHEGQPPRQPPRPREGASRPPIQQAGPAGGDVGSRARQGDQPLGTSRAGRGGRAGQGRDRVLRGGGAGHAGRHRRQVQPEGEGARPRERARRRPGSLRGGPEERGRGRARRRRPARAARGQGRGVAADRLPARGPSADGLGDGPRLRGAASSLAPLERRAGGGAVRPRARDEPRPRRHPLAGRAADVLSRGRAREAPGRHRRHPAGSGAA